MHKKIILWFLAGWLLALLIPPTKLLGYVRGGGGGS